MTLHALLIEDHDGHAKIVADELRGIAHVQHATHADEALHMLRSVVPDVLIADVRGTSDASPAEHVASLRLALDAAGERGRVGAQLPLVLLSGVDPDVLRDLAASVPATHAMSKPFHRHALRALVARVTGVEA